MVEYAFLYKNIHNKWQLMSTIIIKFYIYPIKKKFSNCKHSYTLKNRYVLTQEMSFSTWVFSKSIKPLMDFLCVFVVTCV